MEEVLASLGCQWESRVEQALLGADGRKRASWLSGVPCWEVQTWMDYHVLIPKKALLFCCHCRCCLLLLHLKTAHQLGLACLLMAVGRGMKEAECEVDDLEKWGLSMHRIVCRLQRGAVGLSGKEERVSKLERGDCMLTAYTHVTFA